MPELRVSGLYVRRASILPETRRPMIYRFDEFELDAGKVEHPDHVVIGQARGGLHDAILCPARTPRITQ